PACDTSVSLLISHSYPLLFFLSPSPGVHRDLHSFPTRRSSDLSARAAVTGSVAVPDVRGRARARARARRGRPARARAGRPALGRSEEHTSELQSRGHLVCRLLLEKKKNIHHLILHAQDEQPLAD